MDIRKVKKLIELLEESGIAEIEIKEGEESVRISRTNANAPVMPMQYAPAPAPILAAAPSPAETASTEPAIVSGHQVKSPMVGTFYEASSPGATPFTEVGKQVKEGDVICIIEAMKIMNQIESDANGVISRVLAENGDPVEFGQPLFLVREA